ncbi:uncharacterized protein LOC125229759 isoform X2 [Leguminivora glycinivorella]|uniref:uncharacterized protein LOC125229759 isoform X2 n=1 Tax=Leguminivora glycinivorella TaxID=1035111 RepID=UPI00200F4445|nr:uncharacterized protein LOC125229759 isoform X2 [Leguminivora glycinivorella]
MRTLILFAAIAALAWARPETYKETEEFQYSRSSSDEGSKSGYYGAQRGNVAGNYEKAHNMDSLAQHQMSGAINQVQGELGDASKTRAGSVYTAANTAGVYGSGYHDRTNLQGRNFGESSSSDSSHSSLSSAYNQHANSDWRSQSQHSGYGASSQLGQSSLHSGNLHAADATGYESNIGSNSRSSGYHSASGYQSHSGYNSQNYDQSQLQSGSLQAHGIGDQTRRYTIVTPVRIVARPGAQIAIPVYGEAGYDAHRAASSFDQSSSNRYTSHTAASSFDQNAINSEAEVLANNQQHIGSVPAPTGKHYSSSYNYQKAWERHSETTDAPVTVAPVVNPLSVNSELYEDAQGASANVYNSANRHNSYSGISGSSQSSHQAQADYRAQHNSHSAQSNTNSNAYTQGAYGSHSGLAPLVDGQPKNYQSSYSYHKSWEKQGDPYVIYPGSTGEASQRIVSGTKNSASSQRYGSQQDYTHGSAVDCDSLCRYRRSTRSANYYHDLGQQAQTAWDQSVSQQTQDFYQQQSQSAHLEDLGQQTQNLEDFSQNSQSAKLEDLGQQTQNLEDFSQHSQSAKLEDLGQQTQELKDFGQHSKPAKLEDLGQQTQKLEDFGQQTQQSWGNFQQQAQSEKLEDLGQQTQNLDNLSQQTQQSWSNNQQQRQSQNLEDFGQQTQESWR